MKPAPTRGSMATQRRLQPRWFRQCGLAGCGHPALRTRPLVRRRGGLYGRPDRVAFPTTPPAEPRRAACPHAAADQVRCAPGPGGCGGLARTRDARPYGVCVRRGVSNAAVRSGRIYNPPLQIRSGFPRRGGLYGRPEPSPDSCRGSMAAAHAARGALHA